MTVIAVNGFKFTSESDEDAEKSQSESVSEAESDSDAESVNSEEGRAYAKSMVKTLFAE